MIPKKFIAYAEIDENGIPRHYDKKDVLNFCKMHPDRRVEITYKVITTTDDSSLQRGYYWSVIVPNMKFGLTNIGYRMNNLQVHEFVRQQSSVGVEITVINGSKFKQIQSTSKDSFDKADWSLYIDECIQFAAEELDIAIPEPNHNRYDLTKGKK